MIEKFWSRVNKAVNGCWEWTGSTNTGGYGNTRWGRKTALTHRLAYSLSCGPIPDGACILHSCDNRTCCNPSHLRIGTHRDNMADMRIRGRRRGIGTGASNGRARLTQEQVDAIRRSPHGKIRLSRQYAISPAQIQRIRAGKQWVAA